MSRPPTKSLNRVRWRREREAVMESEKGYDELEVWPGRVLLRYCGHDLLFVPDGHTIALVGVYNIPFMTPEDRAFLFRRAEKLLKAAERAAKAAAKRRAKKENHKVKQVAADSMPRHDKRQLSLL